MTRDEWHALLAEWCPLLGIATPPRLVVVPASAIPGCDAVAEFDDTRATHWTIKVRRGYHADPALIMVHELLHVRTGLTDATHEAWICDVSAALVKGYRAAP
jgi:hypothetical protein